MKDINYELNSHQLTPEAEKAIDEGLYAIMINNPGIVVKVMAHTDSKGSESYNLSLSEKRANSVVHYLTAKGIEKNRLKPQGYGESKPIAPNTYPDGSDNPEGRRLNRRTEFEIIGQIDPQEEEE